MAEISFLLFCQQTTGGGKAHNVRRREGTRIRPRVRTEESPEWEKGRCVMKKTQVRMTTLEKVMALLAVVGPLVALMGVWLFLR